MKHTMVVACASATLLAFAVACSNDSTTPVSPTASEPGTTAAAADGSTLKATPPEPIFPVNNVQPEGSLVLIATKSVGKFTDITPSYEFEVYRGSNRVYASGVVGGVAAGPNNVSHTVNATLEFGEQHTWRARAVFLDAVGPWGTSGTFLAPAGGFIRDDGVFDPLTNGQTVGEVVGPVTFIPGVGARLDDFSAHIKYRMPRTLTTGEFSLIMTGVPTNSEGEKTKVMACSEGLSDLITNDRRLTVEKRGEPAGIVAWRIITRDDQKDTEGAEREVVGFDASEKYLWRASWNGFFNVSIQAGGSTGPTIYSKGKHYDGVYDPNPMYCFAGAPSGRSGLVAASIPGMIVRNVWISANPRPAGLD